MGALRRSDVEEEGIDSVRASIESYLAKFNEGVAKKEAAIVQARSAWPYPLALALSPPWHSVQATFPDLRSKPFHRRCSAANRIKQG